MHWPIAFKPGAEPFPKGEDGKPILDNEVTVSEVAPYTIIILLADVGGNGETLGHWQSQSNRYLQLL